MDNENKDFYNAKWREWNDMILYSPAPRIRREKIIEWVKKNSCGTLIDIGCGNGEFLRQAYKALPGTQMSGADISSDVIKANRNQMPAFKFFELDLDREALSLQFDGVVCMEVIEHCSDYRAAISRLAAMSGKHLFITVPCGPVFPIDRQCGHKRHPRAKDIALILEQSGFEIIELQQWGFPFFNLYKYAINLFPRAISKSFLVQQRYGWGKKLVCAILFAIFKFNLPCLGFQLFVAAKRR